MSDAPLIIALPSKGRLMEKAGETFAKAGLTVRKTGHERGYRGEIAELKDVEIAFLSASEITRHLRQGRVHAGITGQDLIGEASREETDIIAIDKPLGFGHADVVVAVPDCWIDVSRMSDLEDAAALFMREHGRRLRVATKYMNLTYRFFTRKGVTGYRIVESLGATEGTPAAGSAELIVDITSTGSTLKANNLKVLDDGLILKSQAVLAHRQTIDWSPSQQEMYSAIVKALQD